MPRTFPEGCLIGGSLFIVKRFADLQGFTLLLAYDVRQSTLLKKPVFVHVRMVHHSNDWASKFSKEDEGRFVVKHEEYTFIVLETTRLGDANASMCIEEDKLVLLKQIGKGGQGIVYFAHDLTDPSSPFVAVKQLSQPQNKRDSKRQEREMYLHSRAALFGHPNIACLRRAFRYLGTYFLVMDYHFGGDLNSDVHRNPEIYLGNDELIRNIVLQLIQGVRFLHGEGIYHW
jgi:hypothetical protein